MAEQSRILVTGATGNVGGHVVDHLVRAGQRVRALTRSPAAANLPDGVEIVAGDPAAPETLLPALDGVTGMHLIAFSDDGYTPLQTAPEVIKLATQAGVRRVTVLTGTDDELAVARAVEDAGVEWTHLRPGEFMANALFWTESIRTEGVVRAPFGGQLHAMVHEADVAAIVATALLEDGHAGQTYTPTGPEALTRAETVRTIADVIGRDIRFVELTEEQGREQLRESGYPDEVIEAVIEYGANPPEAAYTVLPTVEEVTGTPARTFRQWAADHADDFR